MQSGNGSELSRRALVASAGGIAASALVPTATAQDNTTNESSTETPDTPTLGEYIQIRQGEQEEEPQEIMFTMGEGVYLIDANWDLTDETVTLHLYTNRALRITITDESAKGAGSGNVGTFSTETYRLPEAGEYKLTVPATRNGANQAISMTGSFSKNVWTERGGGAQAITPDEGQRDHIWAISILGTATSAKWLASRLKEKDSEKIERVI